MIDDTIVTSMIVVQCSKGKVRSCNQIQIEWKKKNVIEEQVVNKSSQCAMKYISTVNL